MKTGNRKKLIIAAAAAVLAAAGLAALAIWVIAPAVQYGRAVSMEQKDNTAGAYDLYDRLGDYRDAPEAAKRLQDEVIASCAEKTMAFAGYDWLVLEQRAGKALLLMRDILEKRPFDEAADDAETKALWEACTLRAWLNGTFYKNLPAADRARIAETALVNGRNGDYGTRAGGDSLDFVFLLSLEQAKLYFPDDAARVAKDPGGNAAWWWLRSPGEKAGLAAVVDRAGALGSAGSGVNYYDRGVRPAIWIVS